LVIGFTGLVSSSSGAQTPASDIIIEDADGVWTDILEHSAGLIDVAANVIPRVISEYANYIFGLGLYSSDDLNQAASAVPPRIIVECGNSIFGVGLYSSDNLNQAANIVTPRVIVEYANSIFETGLYEIEPVLPVLSVSPASLDFGATQTQKTFNISNAGGGTLTWSISEDKTWLSVSPTSGTGDTTVTVNVDRSGLSPGDYTAGINVSSNGGNETVHVTMEVEEIPSVDLRVEHTVPVQVLEGQSLVVDKATAVRAIVSKTGSKSVNDVQVKLTLGANELTSFYVSEPDNWDARFGLQQDNTAYPLSFSSTETSKIIYFFGNALAPTTAGDYNVTAEVDYLNLIPETNEGNNVGSATGVRAYEARWGTWPFSALRLRHVPVEQRRSPTVVNYAETQTDFIEATYPVAISNLQKGVSIIPFIRSCRMSNGFCLNMSFLELWAEGKLVDPTADRVIGIAPNGWLYDNYPSVLGPATKGVSLGPSVHSVFVEMESGVGTTAHEVGHTYGLRIGCEEYDSDCDGQLDNLGNAVHGGLYVVERRVMNDSDMKGAIRHGVYCFMGTADYDPPAADRFVCPADYQVLVAKTGGTTGQVASRSEMTEDGILLVMGLIRKDGTAELLDWYRLPEGAPDELEPGPYVLQALDREGQILYQRPFTMTFTLMGAIDPSVEEAPFAFSVPFIPGTAEFVLQHEEQTLAGKDVSAHSPTVTVLTPNGGEELRGYSTVEWVAEDADGDALTYAIFLSSDNGVTWSTLAMDVTTTTYALDAAALPAGTSNLIKVMATDGVNTGQDLSDAPFTIIGKLYLPLVMKNWSV
jgi:hypothetical protein